jgi:hypothetical protein
MVTIMFSKTAKKYIKMSFFFVSRNNLLFYSTKYAILYLRKQDDLLRFFWPDYDLVFTVYCHKLSFIHLIRGKYKP